MPVGRDNHLEPGDPDQGQPTHFFPRRNQFVFKVRVPSDFGDPVWYRLDATFRAGGPSISKRINLEVPLTRITSCRFAAIGLVLALATTAPALADYRLEEVLTLSPGGELNLRLDSVRVTVRGTSRPSARLVITSRRDDFEERFRVTFEENPGGVTVTAKKRGLWVRRWFSWRGDSVHFEVEVPYETALDLHTSGGRIEVSEIRGDVKAYTSGGGIELEEVSGWADLRTSGGAISFERIEGELSAETSGGSIRGADVGGDVDVHTSGGSIDLRGMAGAVNASTSGGGVTVYFARGNSRGGSLSTSGGRVAVHVDPDVALDIDASSSGGRVTLDLPVSIQGRLSRTAVRGALNGGGARLRVRLSGGGVSVRSL